MSERVKVGRGIIIGVAKMQHQLLSHAQPWSINKTIKQNARTENTVKQNATTKNTITKNTRTIRKHNNKNARTTNTTIKKNSRTKNTITKNARTIRKHNQTKCNNKKYNNNKVTQQ